MEKSYEQLQQDLHSTQEALLKAQKELLDAQKELLVAHSEISKLKSLLKIALERITELENKINKNSKNSSKPPSSDQKGNTSGRDPDKHRKSRSGISRKLYPPERVDQHVECTLETCPHCHSQSLSELSNAPAIWQQVELPAVKAIVTQFNFHKYRCCHCGEQSIASLPEGVPHSSFGPKLMALIATLTGRFHLAKRESVQLVGDLYGVDVSEGSVINIEERVANALNTIYERIHKFVIQKALARYFDETSWRNDGKRHYVWLATSASAAYYRIDPSRSQEAFFSLVGKHVSAASVTDRYSAYNALDGPHQYCLAHLIRDFHFFSEKEGETGEIGLKIEKELRKACGIQADWRKGEISKKQRAARLAHSKHRLDELFTDGIAFGNDELSSLCLRLSDSYEHLWVFSSHEGVEPTNNLAERDLRKLVLWRKKSYGTRSKRGQFFVERITSVVETVKKNCANVLYFLEEAVSAFYFNRTPPYINAAIGV